MSRSTEIRTQALKRAKPPSIPRAAKNFRALQMFAKNWLARDGSIAAERRAAWGCFHPKEIAAR